MIAALFDRLAILADSFGYPKFDSVFHEVFGNGVFFDITGK